METIGEYKLNILKYYDLWYWVVYHGGSKEKNMVSDSQELFETEDAAKQAGIAEIQALETGGHNV